MPLNITILLYTTIFLFGIVIGSFCNVCIYRIPRKESLIPNSHCMSCGNRLKWYDMFPIVSFLLLRGRCRQCGEKISIQYPLIEAVSGVLYVIVFMAGGFTMRSILYCLMTSALLVIAVIDERTFEIPINLNAFLVCVGIVMTMYDNTHMLSHILGAFVVSLFLYGIYRLSHGRAIGGGDIKLMAAAGLIVGARDIVLAFILACVLGSVIHSLRMKFAGGRKMLALGPYLSAGIYISALFGEAFVHWYLSCLGL